MPGSPLPAPSTPPSPHAPGLVDDTLGALLIGTIVASCLWGIIIQQAYRYRINFPTDPWYLQALVAAACLTETAQQASISWGIYQLLIANYGDIAITARLIPSNYLELFFTGATAIMVKFFFLSRIWRLSGRNYWLVSPIALAALAEFGLTYAFATTTAQRTFFSQLKSFVTVTTASNICGAVADILVSVALCALLLPERNSMFRRSRSLIDQIILFSTANGILTSLCAIAVLITTNRFLGQDWSIAFYHNLGRLHVNALLTTLNMRRTRAREEPRGSSMLADVTFLRTPSQGTPVIRIGKNPRATSNERFSTERESVEMGGLSSPPLRDGFEAAGSNDQPKSYGVDDV